MLSFVSTMMALSQNSVEMMPGSQANFEIKVFINYPGVVLFNKYYSKLNFILCHIQK